MTQERTLGPFLAQSCNYPEFDHDGPYPSG
jgi:hypothetical protein